MSRLLHRLFNSSATVISGKHLRRYGYRDLTAEARYGLRNTGLVRQFRGIKRSGAALGPADMWR